MLNNPDFDFVNVLKASTIPTLLISILHPFDIIKTRFQSIKSIN